MVYQVNQLLQLLVAAFLIVEDALRNVAVALGKDFNKGRAWHVDKTKTTGECSRRAMGLLGSLTYAEAKTFTRCSHARP